MVSGQLDGGSDHCAYGDDEISAKKIKCFLKCRHIDYKKRKLYQENSYQQGYTGNMVQTVILKRRRENDGKKFYGYPCWLCAQ